MKLNLLLLSVAALVNAAKADPILAEVDLKTAGDFVILAKTGISTVPASVVTGNIAVSPITVAAITGFGLILDSSGTFSTASQLIGQAYGPDYVSPTPSVLTTAVGDMETAYTDAAGRPNDADPAKINLGSGIIGGMTLQTGVYTFDVDITIGTGTKLYFDGSDTDVFILRTTGSVVLAAGAEVILLNGALAKNIFWQVAGEVIVGAGAHLEGVLLVKTAAVFNTGASLNGRILVQTAVTLQMAVITEPPAISA
jgi:hypothetical protein